MRALRMLQMRGVILIVPVPNKRNSVLEYW